MTDQEKFIELMTEFGFKDIQVQFSKEQPWPFPNDNREQHKKIDTNYIEFGGMEITVNDSLVAGYGGFYAHFHFDMDGKFVQIGVYE